MRALLSQKRLDRLGSCLSAACAVHCSLKPLLFILPSVAWLDVLVSQQFEGVMLTVGVLLASGSVAWGYARHRSGTILVSLAVAVVVILAGRLIGSHGWVQRSLVIPGGVLLALTHWLNLRCCRSCNE